MILREETARQELKRIKAECHKLADYLKRQPYCLACEVEMQQNICIAIEVKWAGRELLRIVDRQGWITKAWEPKPSPPPPPPIPRPLTYKEYIQTLVDQALRNEKQREAK
jgi:hypothetical protein